MMMVVILVNDIYLKLVSEVDDNGVVHRRDVDPFVVFEELKAADLVVLEEEDDAAGIGVGTETTDELRPGTRRVVAHLGPKRWPLLPTKCLLQVALWEPQVLTEEVKQVLCQLFQLGYEFSHSCPVYANNYV